MRQVTVIGGGVSGLVAAITAAEAGADVRLLEAHDALGGRARSTDGPYKANLGPHVLYKDGPLWAWLRERDILPASSGPPLSGVRFRYEGAVRRTPPLDALPAILKLRGRKAPVDRSFRDWAAEQTGERIADMLARGAGVYTFHHDPGELSAQFIWERTVRAALTLPPAVRYVTGGWNAFVGALDNRARSLGVHIVTRSRVESLPDAPVVVATELRDAGTLLGEELTGLSATTLCFDFAVRSRRGDPFVVSDLDEAGWAERFSAPDPSLAPDGEDLFQAHMPIRPGESADQAQLRLECMLDEAVPGWRERETWRRRQVMDGRSGALDMPGTTWRDRPAIDRGGGVFLAGDMVAAPGLLSEVAWASGVEAGTRAAELARSERPALRSVA